MNNKYAIAQNTIRGKVKVMPLFRSVQGDVRF